MLLTLRLSKTELVDVYWLVGPKPVVLSIADFSTFRKSKVSPPS